VNAGPEPYPAMKDSGVAWLGDVPKHWDVRRVRNAVDMRVSTVDKHIKEGELPIRLCNYVDVYKNDLITERLSFMRATATAAEIERFGLQPNDVLITKDSEAWNDIGVAAMVEYTARDLVCGYHLALLRPRKDQLTGAYLLRALQTPAVSYQFHVAANGVTRYGLSHDAIKSVLLPIPPLPEQAAIVRFLDQAERHIIRYIRTKQKLIKVLEEEKQAIVCRAVTGGLDADVRLKPSGVEWLGDLPECWDVRRAKRLFREVDRRSTTGTEMLLSLRMYQGLVPHKHVSAILIPAQNLIGFKKVEPGQIVMNRMRAAIGLFGIADQPGLVSPDYTVLEPIVELDPTYFLLLFKTSAAGSVFRRESKGLGTGSSGFMRLYTDRFSGIKLPVPPHDEQRLIVQAVSSSTEKIRRTQDRVNVEVALLRTYRTRLIGDVVTGKLDMREAAAALPDENDDHEPSGSEEQIDGFAESDGQDIEADEVEA
jgi:type I restriction enzyme, S subunit